MSAEDPRPACDLLLVGGLVLTLDAADRIIPDGAIAVAADRIVDIGPPAAIEPRWRARADDVGAGPRTCHSTS
jgi:cytosine/adenosine deaminase-related metal-dependent hydrolase